MCIDSTIGSATTVHQTLSSYLLFRTHSHRRIYSDVDTLSPRPLWSTMEKRWFCLRLVLHEIPSDSVSACALIIIIIIVVNKHWFSFDRSVDRNKFFPYFPCEHLAYSLSRKPFLHICVCGWLKSMEISLKFVYCVFGMCNQNIPPTFFQFNLRCFMAPIASTALWFGCVLSSPVSTKLRLWFTCNYSLFYVCVLTE